MIEPQAEPLNPRHAIERLADKVRQPEAPPASRSEPTVRWMEFLAIFCMVLLANDTIYNTRGDAGLAAFFVGAPLLIALGAVKRFWNLQTFVVVLLTYGVAARLLWCGNTLATTLGFLLISCFSLSLAGGALYVLDVLRFVGGLLPSSAYGLMAYDRWARSLLRSWLRIPAFSRVLQFVLPPVTGIVFLTIFVLANPDLSSWMANEISAIIKSIDLWLSNLVDSPLRIVFWCAVIWISVGLLRPKLVALPIEQANNQEPSPSNSEFYFAFRNTLVVLIGLFSAYLLFEFCSMWTRTFPENFHYSGYAHEGAAWLTVALGLATLLLSLIFRGEMLRDDRLPRLQKLAMIWSLENLLLAVAVYNRLFIYIHFNGMTRMRVVGLLGISAVVAGLILVVVKIRRKHRFAWVVRHQLIALSMVVYLYAVLPVDAFVMWFNVRQIMAGNPKPSVQIAHHPTSLEGKLLLFPLLKCDNTAIRNGVAELLNTTESNLYHDKIDDWTAYQGTSALFTKQATQYQSELSETARPADSWQFFKDYSFQWY